ncbi:MAG: hypothetical protein CO022_06945 [Flavobacteriales bacterium CG_4_9_14_0_2_um_filter_32_27]|nr:MAG: hypothetical protein CO022_06945 [Flavobacteriales bacterium CG_4_9_14_0_2_um_filter_32_27]
MSSNLPVELKITNDIKKNLFDVFLAIKPLDTNKLDAFYKKNKDDIDKRINTNDASQEKYLTMICEIGNAYSFSERHIEADKILKKANKILKAINRNSTTNILHNSILFCLAYSNFNLRKYFTALSYFKKYKPKETDCASVKTMISICEEKIKAKVLLIMGVIGFCILIVKYSIKWLYPENFYPIIHYIGWIGIILLLIYGFSLKKSKKK